MLRKGLIAGFFAAMLSINVFAADVVVRVAPPSSRGRASNCPRPDPDMYGRQAINAGTATLMLGARCLGSAAACACPLGGPSLGPSQWRLGNGGRPLALEP